MKIVLAITAIILTAFLAIALAARDASRRTEGGL